VIESDADLCDYFLDHHLVAIVPGSAFGMADHVRISYAASDEELAKACDRIENAMRQLKPATA
jgi:aspartate aminotransferase